MPHVLGFLALAFGVGASGASAGAVFAASLIVSTATSLVIGQVARLFKKSPTASNLASQGGSAGRSITSRQAAAPRRVLFGRHSRLGGVITFIATSGTSNEYIHLVITLTGHRVSNIYKMFFDGVEVTLDGSDGDATRAGTGTWSGLVDMHYSGGGRYTTGHSTLNGIGGWTANHRQRGCASAYVRLKYNQSVFPNGLPNITFDVAGAYVYDPRSGGYAYSNNAALCTAEYMFNATWGMGAQTKAALTGSLLSHSGMGSFSGNNSVDGDLTVDAWNTDAAVANAFVKLDLGSGITGEYRRFRMYMDGTACAAQYDIQWSNDNSAWTTALPFGASSEWFIPDVIGWNEVDLAPNGAHRYWRLLLKNTPGAGADVREIQFWTSDVDTTQLTAAANTCDEDVSLLAGGTENRYECNGSFDTSELASDVLPRLNSSMAGYSVYISGKWGIYPAAWPGSSLALTLDDLRGPLSVQTRVPHSELYNGVKGVFVSPANGWQLSDFPPYIDEDYRAEDDNEALWLDVEYPFTTSGSAVQRISKILLERRRRQISFTAQFKLNAWQVQPMDVVTFTHSRFSWTSKYFEVAAMSLVYEDDGVVGVTLTLRELDSTAFDWTTADEDSLNTVPVPVLPDPATCAAPTSLAATNFSTTRVADGVAVSGVRLTWTSPVDQNVTQGGKIVIQYKKNADSDWIPWTEAAGDVVLADVLPLVDGSSYNFRIWAVNIYDVKSSVVSVSKTPSATQLLIDTIGDGTSFYRPPQHISLPVSDTPYNSGFEIFPDGQFIADGWQRDLFFTSGPNANYSRSSSPYNGTYAQSVACVNGVSGGEIISRPFGVKAGLKYDLGFRVKASAANKGSLFGRVLFFTDDSSFDNAGNWAAQGSLYGSIVEGNTTNSTSWTSWTGTITAPAGAKFARIILFNHQSGATGTLTFDTVGWRLSQIQDAQAATPVTSLPVYQNTTPAVIPEMTATFTTYGGKVLCIFSCDAQCVTYGTSTSGIGFIQIYRDGSPIGNPFTVASFYALGVMIVFLDSPSAGSHTYAAYWWGNSGSDVLSMFDDCRLLQANEVA